MAIGINSASNTLSNISDTSAALKQRLERIASGHRINSAKDDAAGVIISEQLDALTQGLATGSRNANDAVSLAQVAEGGLSQVNDSLQRIRELGIQASNPTLGDQERQALQQEVNQLQDEIQNVIDTTSFGDVQVLSQNQDLSFQVGAEANQSIDVRTSNLGQEFQDNGFGNIDISTAEGAQNAVGTVDQLLDQTSQIAADFGAVQNRFSSAITTNTNNEINSRDANSRISDADLARETAEATKASILQKAEISLQGQANQSSRVVTALLNQ